MTYLAVIDVEPEGVRLVPRASAGRYSKQTAACGQAAAKKSRRIELPRSSAGLCPRPFLPPLRRKPADKLHRVEYDSNWRTARKSNRVAESAFDMSVVQKIRRRLKVYEPIKGYAC